jgi:hypothetical protein
LKIFAARANFLAPCGKEGRPAGRPYFFFAYFAFFAVKSSPSSVRGRDESRPYFVIFVPFVVKFFSALVAALPR